MMINNYKNDTIWLVYYNLQLYNDVTRVVDMIVLLLTYSKTKF